mmetsp:Transcript_22383/g.76689  ORF Transcript_22383/g.76689 Transcript_22383/m.76689 type:complete len:631 (+) Transcript_22383:282-2174(+)
MLVIVAASSALGGLVAGWVLHAASLRRRPNDTTEGVAPNDVPNGEEVVAQSAGEGTARTDRRQRPRLEVAVMEEPESEAQARWRRTVTGGSPISPLMPMNFGFAKGELSSTGLRTASGGPVSGTRPSARSMSTLGRRGRAKRVYGLGGYSQSSRVMLCMVGLPARGKSYITKMMERYLQWSGFPVRIFNAGNLRRQEGMAGASAGFFSDENKEASAMREKVASACMEEAINWLQMQTNVCVVIFDATNTTKRRRQMVVERCRESRGITPVFIESICDDPGVLEENYRLKMGNQDYQDMDPAQAREDFMKRVKAYESRYETIDDDEQGGDLMYIKLFNVGQKVVMHSCSGYLVSQIGFYLSNIHIQPRSIWLTRHAEFEDETRHSEVTARGRAYCGELANHLLQRRQSMRQAGEGECAELLVLMGTAPVHATTFELIISSAGAAGSCTRGSPQGGPTRTYSGAPGLTGLLSPQGSIAEEGELLRGISISSHDSGISQEFPAMSTSLLNELDRGDYASISYDEIHREHPEVWAERQRDPLHFRYPGVGGESYTDVIGRLRPIIIELERQRRSVLVISHLAVQRCLYAYFTGCTMEEIPNMDMPMHELVELQPGPFGCKVTRTSLDAQSDGTQ